MSDIKIIGAGPGGLLSGLYLQKRGFSPKIFEKQTRENYKSTPCAGGISRRLIEKLEKDLNFNSESSINNEVDEVAFYFPNGKKAFLEDLGVIILNRNDWLKALAKEFESRGGEIEYDKKIENLEDMDYDYLIGAEGPISETRNFINGKVEVVAGCQYRFRPDNYEGDSIEFHWDKRFSDYYSWIFPKDSYLKIGCGGNIRDLDRFLESRNIEGRILEREVHPITFNGTKFQEGNIFLVGDAAGMVNPVLGSGLGPIIFASEIISECIQDGRPNEYEERIKKTIPSPKIIDILFGLEQKDLEKLGEILEGKNLQDFLEALFDGETILDFVERNYITNIIKNNFLTIFRDSEFLIKTLRIYKKRDEVRKGLRLW